MNCSIGLRHCVNLTEITHRATLGSFLRRLTLFCLFQCQKLLCWVVVVKCHLVLVNNIDGFLLLKFPPLYIIFATLRPPLFFQILFYLVYVIIYLVAGIIYQLFIIILNCHILFTLVIRPLPIIGSTLYSPTFWLKNFVAIWADAVIWLFSLVNICRLQPFYLF